MKCEKLEFQAISLNFITGEKEFSKLEFYELPNRIVLWCHEKYNLFLALELFSLNFPLSKLQPNWDGPPDVSEMVLSAAK